MQGKRPDFVCKQKPVELEDSLKEFEELKKNPPASVRDDVIQK